MSRSAYGWNWAAFKGSPEALNWAMRDIKCLDTYVAKTSGRTAVIQAGGNLGIFPKRLAQSFETVYTFEPSLDLFPMLMANAPEPNIVKFQAALGDTRALVGMARTRRGHKVGPPHEGITHVSGPGVVPTLRVDDLGLTVCDLLQLDLEGFELFALRGAIETLNRCRPVVAVEINHNISHYGFSTFDVKAFLHSVGYREVDKQHSDFVFLPEERAA